MKRIGILIACLLALACCAPAPAETVPAAGEGVAAVGDSRGQPDRRGDPGPPGGRG